MTPDPTLPVHTQLQAYNARDIDAFMACWATDARYHAFPGTLLAQGWPAIRERHLVRFREPDLHGRLHARTAVGSLVIDHETVTRNFPVGPGEVDVIAMYDVADGLIAQAWFHMGEPKRHTIRRASLADAALVGAMTRAAYASWVPLIGREPTPMTIDYGHAVQAHRIELLCIAADPAALIEMVPAADHLLIENVAVLPAQQGRGYGRRLLAHAESVARDLGLPQLRLYTNEAFAGNVRLYQGLGYRIDKRLPFKEGHTLYMSKPTPAR